jgi:hypothetical protein
MDLRVPDKINKESYKEIMNDLINLIEMYKNSKYKKLILKTWFLCNQKNGKVKKLPTKIYSICDINSKSEEVQKIPLINKFIFFINCKEKQEINYIADFTLTYKEDY